MSDSCALRAGAFILLLVTASTSARLAHAADKSPTARPATSPAEAIVKEALQAEASQNPAARSSLLQRAVKEDAAYAPAHWHSGEVLINDHWLTVDAVAQDQSINAKVHEYRQKRALPRTTAKQELDLAEWCVQAGLSAQARAHFRAALNIDPESRAAIAGLNLKAHRGELVPATMIDQIKQQQKATAAAAKKWSKRIEKFATSVDSENTDKRINAKRGIREINDPAAIPVMEALSIEAGSTFGECMVAALSSMPGQEATDALLRQAMYSEHELVCIAAAEGLKERSVFSYVPTLMGALKSPIQVRDERSVGIDRSYRRLVLFQEGPFAARAFNSVGGQSVQMIVREHPNRGTREVSIKLNPDVTLAEDAALARQANAQAFDAKTQNLRVITALGTATGQDLGNDPTKWWDWWLGYNEIYQPPVKPVTTEYRNYIPPPNYIDIRYSSCFVAGTKVWTMTGPMAIESVKAGECVLSQDPATGELAYKPVLGTTVRPASPVRAIHAGAKPILATLGHPFWVSGHGWRMTKELNPGDHLHTADGSVQITSAQAAGAAQCFNLVVAEFGTYFVGDQKILVHDNNIRDVTPATVPGLSSAEVVGK